MKYLLFFLALSACSSTATGSDAGGSDSSTNDTGTSTDASSSNDSSSSNDATTTSDGGLTAGETCDPNDDQCASGLLCCSEPTHMADAMTGYFCEKPVNKGCPLLP